MKYEVIYESHLRTRLEKRIKKAIANGWELQGGVSVSQDNGILYFAQAVIKREQTSEKKNERFESFDGMVIDHETGLAWEWFGSEFELNYKDAKKYIESMNINSIHGFNDWRLPTIMELISLLTKERDKHGTYINSIFGIRKEWFWSSDNFNDRALCVYYNTNDVGFHAMDETFYVRAVRSR